VSAFFVLLFISYLLLKTIRQENRIKNIIDAAEEESHLERDPWRVFKFAPKKRIVKRAENRCEWHSPKGVRCELTNDLEVDHIYPWAAGGWTIESNAQLLCHGHHMVKGGLVPTEEEIARIEQYRELYFPEDVETTVRWRPSEEERAIHSPSLKK